MNFEHWATSDEMHKYDLHTEEEEKHKVFFLAMLLVTQQACSV